METPFWLQSIPDLARTLGSDTGGLSEAEAARRARQTVPSARVDTPFAQLWMLLGNPLVLILLFAASLSAGLGDRGGATLIAGIVGTSLLLDFVQTFRSHRAAEALRRRVAMRADVLREGRTRSVPSEEVVAGDVVLLAAGDIVPGDGRLLEAKDLFLDQAALTGESLPAEKQVESPAGGSLDEAINAVFAGTSVLSGQGKALIVKVGKATEFGRIATELTRRPPPTEFERGITEFSLLILRLTVVLVLFVFLVLSLRHAALEALLFAIALAVGLTPEFLPMIITITLARGALRMAKQQVIVKQLQAIENFGAIDVLCADKTGTLTEGTLRLESSLDPAGNEDESVLASAALNSAFETGLRSPLDQAILLAHPIDKLNELNKIEKLDEIPFDFHRRMLSVVIQQGERRILIAKGAPEALLQASTSIRHHEATTVLDAEGRARLLETFRRLSERGLRVLAVAEREVPAQPAYEPSDERALSFLGFLTFRDPPRPDAAKILATMREDGIRAVILTGDNEWIAQAVCEAVGIDSRRVVTGAQLDGIRAEALPRVAEKVSVFARLSPEQKTRIILALKQAGHVVGFLGDGINDAPSLRAADVGISVESAADVARAAAPIILLDKSLSVLHQGVMEGRRSFANVIKYVMMGTSSNFGNMLSMAAASLFLPFLPMLPSQILLNNILYDASQVTIPGDTVRRSGLHHPRHWNIRFIKRFMLFFGPLSSLFDLLTFGLLIFFQSSPQLFRTGWFVESLLTQTLVIFVIRTHASPWKDLPSPALCASVLGVALTGLVLPFSPLSKVLGFLPLPLPLLLGLLGLSGMYLGCAEWLKRRFYA